MKTQQGRGSTELKQPKRQAAKGGAKRAHTRAVAVPAGTPVDGVSDPTDGQGICAWKGDAEGGNKGGSSHAGRKGFAGWV